MSNLIKEAQGKVLIAREAVSSMMAVGSKEQFRAARIDLANAKNDLEQAEIEEKLVELHGQLEGIDYAQEDGADSDWCAKARLDTKAKIYELECQFEGEFEY